MRNAWLTGSAQCMLAVTIIIWLYLAGRSDRNLHSPPCQFLLGLNFASCPWFFRASLGQYLIEELRTAEFQPPAPADLWATQTSVSLLHRG